MSTFSETRAASEGAPAAAPPRRPGLLHRREFGTLAGLLALCIALWIATPHFLTASNLVNVLEQSAIIGIVAVGMTFVILTAGIDLSVGSIVALSGVALGVTFRAGLPIPLAAGAGLAVG
ncbi:MAG: ABC transporter permease, partial [Gemmatimonadota bacterium]